MFDKYYLNFENIAFYIELFIGIWDKYMGKINVLKVTIFKTPST